MSKIKSILKSLPSQAGVYQFFDAKWKIIYIGKSVNLKSRVNSYFNWKAKLNFAKQKMVEQIADIKYILVENETESLILETNLIKKHLPKYNILMKDGKNHLYIKITDEEWPKIIKTRQKTKSWEYFWPYISTNHVDNILKIIKKIFWYWVWKHNFFKNKNNYSLDEYLFEWNIKANSPEEIKKLYFEKLEKIKKLLKWNISKTKEILQNQMMEFARNLEFERAQIIKEQIESLEILEEKQIVRDWIAWDYDIIYFLEKFEKIFIWKLEIRNSKILGFFPYEIENNLWESKEIILKNFLQNIYLNQILENKEKKLPIIITNEKITLKEDIFKNLKIETPQKWVKLDLLKMAYKNIYEFAQKKHISSLSTKNFTKKTMENILELLNFKQINKNITFECNDISHLSWSHTVASRSVITNWKLDKSKYRKFKIKTLNSWEINDFDSLREIAQRRVLELEKHWNYPDLIIIDWWKPQLSSVYEIFNKTNLDKNKIQLVWIAKKEEILYKFENNNFIEFKLDKNSQELKLIQKLRDEAHRFAISFNRDSRIKSNKKNILESLPWFGPKTRKKLFKKYWSIDNISQANKQDLKKLLNKTQIETLENHWII